MAQSEVQEESEKKGLNFVEEEVFNDLKAGKNGGRLSTRFPPEPNGYLHIGHAKAICMDFGVAEKFGGTCNLRFDDTNPVKEDVEYVDSIREDIHWLGFDWGNREYYASDYFPQLFDLAVRLIKEGKAYVDDQTSEEIAAQKGTPGTPGQESPYRNRSVEENLDLFMRMNAGEFDEGARVLRKVGGSTDLYAGQAVDRIGVKLGFGFPAGAELSRLAAQCDAEIRPKASTKGTDCSFSGLENQCAALLKRGAAPAYVAKYCLCAIAQTILKMIGAARRQEPETPVICAGGVMSSGIIRDAVQRAQPEVLFVPGKYAGDNAIGVAILAAREACAWPM